MAAVPTQLATQSQTVSTSGAASAQQQYDLAYQISPIVLSGGIATNADGGLVPITSLYGQQQQPGTSIDPNEFMARFLVLPGGTLVSNAIGTYPFANAQVAANAVVQQPLTLSMLMVAPVNQPGGYQKKLSMFSGLQSALQLHSASGGVFHVATPASIYFDMLLVSMTDTTHSETQAQIMYQLDFVQPLLTQQAANAAQATLMQRITNGGAIQGTPSWSGNLASSGSNVNGVNAALSNFGGSFAPATGVGNFGSGF